jgi:hypothetical protein
MGGWNRALQLGLLVSLLALPGAAEERSPTAHAEALFEEYRRRAETFDPGLADLYADDARIVNVRKYPDGVPDRALSLTGFQYKAKIRQLMPAVKARRDYSTYSDVRYSTEGDQVRIESTRYSVRKGYTSPYSMLVGPDQGGKWRILEEHSESRP